MKLIIESCTKCLFADVETMKCKLLSELVNSTSIDISYPYQYKTIHVECPLNGTQLIINNGKFNNDNNFVSQFKFYRKRSNLTQVELGELLGYKSSIKSICNIETSRSKFPKKRLDDVITIFKLNESEKELFLAMYQQYKIEDLS